MGGGDNRQYGSPYGGALISRTPQFQFEPVDYQETTEKAQAKDRRSSEDVSPEEDIQMRVFQRMINDILKKKINLDQLRNLPDMSPADGSLPNLNWFNPYA